MTSHGPARTHDLLRLSTPGALLAVTPLPAWAEAALRRVPWVVVRRGAGSDDLIPVGVRGPLRAQRFAGFAAIGAIADRRSPEELVGPAHGRRDAVPAVTALTRVAPVLTRHGRRWGPGGSVGFELATGVPAATPASDLDLIIRQDDRLDRRAAGDLLAALLEVAAPARIDVLLETPRGGVCLAELAARPAPVLVRTAGGARLCADPWGAEDG
ncbi:MAG TPA: malonate decarboxylase holo-ACP synthase [Kofleriaceae bacterium]|nr:malonate decarboxylase holo-ACP synthase [Kofleriaceae bacterium]